MRLKFIGGARTVTGSCTLIETENKKILVDCGLPQGNDEKKIGMALPFESSEIDYVLLTHAHIDHSGRIPLLVKEGFKGIIFSTDATKDLCKIMLADSGHIQEMETEWLNRKRIRAGKNEVQALYTVADAVTAIDFFSGQSYNERLKIDEEIEIEFTDAGHLLGSSSIQIWITENSKTTHLVFSGDIGNLDQPIVKDPMCIREADFVVMESTYGDRLHKQPKYKTQAESTKGRSEDLAKIIRETFAKGGNVVIPSFAVGRTQELLYLLRNIITQNMLPEIPYLPVFLDSPLAIEATKVFSKNIEGYFDREAMALVKQGVNPLMFDSLTLTVTADESKALNFRKESCVIISSSGMCEAGRIKHHLKHNLWREESTIVFCGYQAGGTLGRSILDGAKRVTIFQEQIDIKATITTLEGVSGHADQEGLIKWANCFSTKKPNHIFVVHGEEHIARFFAGFLAAELDIPSWAPSAGEIIDLSEEELPTAIQEKLKIVGMAELKVALQHLENSLLSVEKIGSRLKEHADEALKEFDPKDGQRLIDAINRLSDEIEDLSYKWDNSL